MTSITILKREACSSCKGCVGGENHQDYCRDYGVILVGDPRENKNKREYYVAPVCSK